MSYYVTLFLLSLAITVGVIVGIYLVVLLGKRVASRPVHNTPTVAPLVPPVVAPVVAPIVVTPAPAPVVAAPPIVPVPPARSWWPSWNFSWFRSGASYATSAFSGTSVMSVLLALIAVALAIWALQQPGLVVQTTTTPPLVFTAGGGGFFDTADPWSLGLGFAAIVMVIIAFVVADRLKLVTFLYVTVLVLIVYAMYKHGTLDVGQRRNILYILAIAAAILVLKYATTFSERLTFGILVAALFIMLGFSHLYSWNQFTSLFGWPSGHGSQVASDRGTTIECDGKLTVYEYSSGTTYRVNSPPCQLRGYVMSGCVTWFDIGLRPLGQTCNGPVAGVPPGIQHMVPDSVAVVRLNHCRAFAPGVLVDVCA